MRKHIERQFPKKCSSCGRVFPDLAHYLRETVHVGEPVSYDAELKDWMPIHPVGTLSFANCSCGSTIAISSKGMGLIKMWRLLRWSRIESAKQGIDVRTLLARLRKKIDDQVLQGAG